MDRLFKKRTNTVRDPRRAPSRQNSGDQQQLQEQTAAQASSSSSSKLSIRSTSSKRTQKGRAKLDAAAAAANNPSPPASVGDDGGGGGRGKAGQNGNGMLAAPPSLDMDFRHSLLLPGLSQRFSVLLPSLSSIPEQSLRPLLASQRLRNGPGALGPAITEEEEEMIFAELQDLAQAQKAKLEAWADAPADNPVWSTMNLARWEHGADIPATAAAAGPIFGSSPGSEVQKSGPGMQRISELSREEVSGRTQSGLSGSISSPNLLSPDSSSPPLHSAGSTSASTPMDELDRTLSPPPTSTSMDSLSTVGSNGSDKTRKERDERAMARSRGYGGFGGGARMQEDAYLRRTRKESERNVASLVTSRSISGVSLSQSQASGGGAHRAESAATDFASDSNMGQRKAKGLSPISADLANADWNLRAKTASPVSPTASDRTATPTSAYPPSMTSPVGTGGQKKKYTRHSPSSSLSLNLPPQPPVPTSPPPEPPSMDIKSRPPVPPTPIEPPKAEPVRQSVSVLAIGRAPKQRKSMLSVLSESQLKRISLALFEIGKELEAMGIKTTDDTDEEGEVIDEERDVDGQGREEVLEGVEEEHLDQEEQHDEHGTGTVGRRKRVDSKSESGHSTGSSSVFPYHVSPTTSSFATVPAAYDDPDGSSSASAAKAPTLGRIPASPKVLDLHAHISPPPSFEPLPPAHASAPAPTTMAPAPAAQTTSGASSLLRKQSVVIQEGSRPKPILTPSRTVPAKHTPSDSIDGSTPLSASAIPGYVPGQLRPVGSVRSDTSSRSGTPVGNVVSYISQEHTPTPASRTLPASLSRSQSVQAGSGSQRTTPTAQHQHQHQHQRNVSLGYVTDSWRSASPLAQMSRSSAAGIEEEVYGDEAGDSAPGSRDSRAASGRVSPRVPSDDERDIRVQQVVGKHSVARARSDAKQRKLGKGAAGARTDGSNILGGVSASPSLLDVPEASRPKYASHQSQQAAIEGGSEHSHVSSAHDLGDMALSHLSHRAAQHDDETSKDPARRASKGSSYKGYSGTYGIDDDMPEDDYLQTPNTDVHELEAILGVSKATMAELQDKLVARAKAEREAFRAEMGDSPAMVMSPSMTASDLPAVPVQMRVMSPLAAPASVMSRAITPIPRTSDTSPVVAEVVEAQQATKSAAVLVPEALFTGETVGPSTSPVNTAKSTVVPPPAHTVAGRSTSIASQSAMSQKSGPPSLPQSRKPSQGGGAGKLAPEDDPDVVRDFEARIAAATAALQRQPSVSGPAAKLERKGTKRSAMKISSPTLVSSSSSISGAILSPTHPDSAPAGMSQAPPSSFKSAKAGHKMSMKWKNAFKRGPSISSSDKEKDSNKSISNPAIFSPPLANQAGASRNVSGASAATTATTNTASSQLTHTSPAATSVPALAPSSASSGKGDSQQPSLGDFRFPPSGNGNGNAPPAPAPEDVSARSHRLPSGNSVGSMRSVLSRMKRGKSDEAVLAAEREVSPASASASTDHRPAAHAIASAPAVQQLRQAEGGSTASHRSTPSDDSAVAKFIAAGRALGLNDEQMNDMLAAKGMLNRSGSARSNGSAALTGGSTASQVSHSPVTPATGIVTSPLVQTREQKQGQEAGGLDQLAAPVIYDAPHADKDDTIRRQPFSEKSSEPDIASTKKEGLAGLVRALSKKRAPKPSDAERDERQRVVRRTILMPENLSHIARFSMREARDSFASPQRSPRSQVSFSGASGLVHPDSPSAPSFQRNRQNSIRRKPIALTAEEEQMMSEHGSPVAPGRSLSVTSDLKERTDANPGLGFLSPGLANERRPSAASGASGASGQSGLSAVSGRESVYDMYGNDSVTNPQQGIEIMEYEDGRMVWNVVDGLRNDDDSASDYTESGDPDEGRFASHSRETSFASTRSGADEGGNSRSLTKEYKLPLRHRDRGASQARPQTNLYFTSPTDVADLIDQLSQDPNAAGKGRIDFSLPSPPPVPDLPTLPAHRTPPLQHGKAAQTGQFEDAPSPGSGRRSPPAPINVTRANQAPAGGWSPKRQAQLRQAFGRAPAPMSASASAHSRNGSASASGSLSGRLNQFVTPPGSTMPQPLASGLIRNTASPGADSLTSLDSPASGTGGVAAARNVEDRLQALMDRLVKSGAVRQA